MVHGEGPGKLSALSKGAVPLSSLRRFDEELAVPRSRGGVQGRVGQALDCDKIKSFNEMVLRDLEVEPDVVPGVFRDHDVGVGLYKAVPWEDAEYLLNRLCEWLEEAFVPPEDRPDLNTMFAVVKAIVAHLYFEWIHPFGNGNGRTGSLIEFHILVSAGVPFPAAHLLSNHYSLTRTKYYLELHKASPGGGDPLSFVRYAVEGLVDGLREQIKTVQGDQLEVMWVNHVHEQIPGSLATSHRRRELVLELSKHESVPRNVMMELTGEHAIL